MKKLMLIISLLFFSFSSYSMTDDFLKGTLDVQSFDPYITGLAQDITLGAKNDFEKSHAIHTWVVENVSYDTNTAEKRIAGVKEDSKQDALFVMITRVAVCEGYANLVAALHRAVGIKAKVVIGKFYFFSKNAYEVLARNNRIPDKTKINYYHAWNEVLINGKWIPMDATSDSGYSGGSEWVRSPTLTEDFFNPDINYFNATHMTTQVLDR